MARFVKIVPKYFHNENRDKRELGVVKELGHEIIVVAKGDKNEITVIDEYDVHCLKTRFLGVENKIFVKLDRVISLLYWAWYISKLNADLISGHDLLGLLIGWGSNIFSKSKAKLVYDAHEFELGRFSKSTHPRYIIFTVKLLENMLIKKTDLNIVVSESISYKLQSIYQLKVKPLVIRNIPSFNNLNFGEDDVTTKKESFGKVFSLMYHGGVVKGRGIEKVLEVLSLDKTLTLTILGCGDDEYISFLRGLIDKYKIVNQVIFHNAVSSEKMFKIIGKADLGMIIAPLCNENHLYMLPNKLFENIQANVPVITSHFPEMRKIVEGYNIGLCCDPENTQEILYSINELRNNKKKYQSLKNNIIEAKKELTWQNEKKILLEEYKMLFDSI